MGQGSASAPTQAPVAVPTTAAPVAPAAPTTPTSNAGLSDKQKAAISAVLSQMGKTPTMPVMQPQQMSNQPATQTIQGGTYINPQQR